MFFLDELFNPLKHCEMTIKHLFECLNININRSTLQKYFIEHPDYPSLLSISDVIKNYGVENVAAKLEYRNFTVHGKSKEMEEYTENGVDKLNTATGFRPDASYSASHVNYVEQINTTSNNKSTNAAGFDNTKATDDISSYVGISGLGLTLGLKYSL